MNSELAIRGISSGETTSLSLDLF